MEIQKLYNANVYLDGTKSLVGSAKEITLPEISATTEEHSALGMIGKVDLPTGLEKLTLSFKWSGFYKDVVKATMNPFAEHKLQIRGNVQVFGAGAVPKSMPVIVEVTGSFLKSGMGTLVAMTGNEPSSEFNAHYLKITLGEEELVEIDILNNIWIVGGTDVLAAYRANLGV